MWWFANGLGMIIVAPLIVTWTRLSSFDLRSLKRIRLLEGLVLGVGLLVSVFHGYSEDQPPPPPLTVVNDSDDAIYLVWVDSDVRDAELHGRAYWNGSVAPGKSRSAPLRHVDAAGELCVSSTTRVLVVESIPGERHYGSNYLDADGVRRHPLPGPGDLRVLHEWEGGRCFGAVEPYFRWDGDRIVPLAPPAEAALDVPGWLAPHLVTVPVAIALVVAGRWIDRRRIGRSSKLAESQSRPCSTA